MKTIALALFGILLLASNSAVRACSCTSEDGRCSTSTRGGGGCFALCGSGTCTSGQTGEASADAAAFTFSGQGISPDELQQRISDDLGVRFIFAARKAEASLTVDIEDASARDLMEGLGKLGAAAVLQRFDGSDEKAAQPMARRFSIKAYDTPAETVSRLLSEMFGDAFTFKATDPKEIVSLDLAGVNLRDLRSILPRVTGIRPN